jgi:hypothetical protein
MVLEPRRGFEFGLGKIHRPKNFGLPAEHLDKWEKESFHIVTGSDVIPRELMQGPLC